MFPKLKRLQVQKQYHRKNPLDSFMCQKKVIEMSPMHLSEKGKDGRQAGRDLHVTVDPKPEGNLVKITDLVTKGFSANKILG